MVLQDHIHGCLKEIATSKNTMVSRGTEENFESYNNNNNNNTNNNNNNNDNDTDNDNDDDDDDDDDDDNNK